MQARCPHCTNVFTTDRSGVQFCPNCGQQINVPGPPGAPPPAPPAPPGATEGGYPGQIPPPPGGPAGIPGPTPWERRRELGFWRGYVQTLKQSMFSPEGFWSSVRPDGPIGDPILYSWLTSAFTFAIAALPMYGIFTWYKRVLGASGDQFPPELRRLMEGEIFTAVLWGSIVGCVLLMPLFAIIAGGIIHVLLLITGGAKGGFSATMRALCYAAGPQLISFIPIIGTVGSIYTMVLFFWGLVRLHRSDWWRPVLSFVILFAFCCCCWVLLIVAGSMAGRAGS